MAAAAVPIVNTVASGVANAMATGVAESGAATGVAAATGAAAATGLAAGAATTGVAATVMSGLTTAGTFVVGCLASPTVMLGSASVAYWSYYLGASLFMQSDEDKTVELFALFSERQKMIEQFAGERIKECQWHLADSETETKEMWEELHPSKERQEEMDQRAEDEACFADALAKLEKEGKSWYGRWAMRGEFNWVKALNSLEVCQDDTRCLCYHLIKADEKFMKSMGKNHKKIDEWIKENDKDFWSKEEL